MRLWRLIGKTFFHFVWKPKAITVLFQGSIREIYAGNLPPEEPRTVTNLLLLLSCKVVFDSLWSHKLKHPRLPCPSPSPRVCSNTCPLNQWWQPTILSSVVPFSSCLQSFSVSGPFLMSWLLASGGQSNGVSASASALPMIFRVDFLQVWLVWSPCCPRDSQESSVAPQFKSINSLALNLPYGPALTSIHDCWKNHSFDSMDLCWQNGVSAF